MIAVSDFGPTPLERTRRAEGARPKSDTEGAQDGSYSRGISMSPAAIRSETSSSVSISASRSGASGLTSP